MSGDPKTGSCCHCVQHPHSSAIPQSQGHTLHKTPGNFPASGLHLSNASVTPLNLTTNCSHLFPCLNLHGAISSKKPSSSPSHLSLREALCSLMMIYHSYIIRSPPTYCFKAW